MSGLPKRETSVNKLKVAKSTSVAALVLGMSLQVLMIAPSYAQSTEDSYLPPEVIPVDASRAQSFQQPQGGGANAGGNVPGLVNGPATAPNPYANFAGGHSAQEMRSQMMNSLMGQGVYPQFQGQTAGSAMNNAASQSFSGGGAPGVNPAANTPGMVGNSQSVGQSGWNTPNPQNAGQGNTTPAQSQMLSGGVQNQTQQAGNRQGAGYSHGFSALSGFGLSALGMGMALRGSPTALYGGTGLAGAGLLNYGFRNGFRF